MDFEPFELRYRRAELIGTISALAQRKRTVREQVASVFACLFIRFLTILTSLISAYWFVSTFVPEIQKSLQSERLNSWRIGLLVGLSMFWLWEAFSVRHIPAQTILQRSKVALRPLFAAIAWSCFCFLLLIKDRLLLSICTFFILYRGTWGEIFRAKERISPFDEYLSEPERKKKIDRWIKGIRKNENSVEKST